MARLVIIGITTASAISIGFAQGLIDVPNGVDIGFGVNQRIEHNTNPNLASGTDTAETNAVTGLDFSVASATRAQSLRVNGGLDLRIDSDPDQNEDEVQADVRPIRLRYLREGAGSSFSTNLSYSNQNVAFIRTLDTFFDPETETFDLPEDIDDLFGEGTREDKSISAGLRLGQDRPLSFALNGSYSDVSYSGTSSALVGSERYGVNSRVGLRLNPVISTNISGGYTRFREDDGSETESYNANIGATYAVSGAIDVSGSVGYSATDQRENGILTSTRDGLTTNIGADIDRPVGAIGLNFSTAPGTDDTTLLSASVTRSYEFASGDTLSGRVGTSYLSDSSRDPTLIGGIRYATNTRQTNLTLSLDRNVRIDDDNNDQSITTGRANIGYDLSDVSTIGLNASVIGTGDLAVDTDTLRTQINLNYSYSLTRDWALRFGAGYDWRRDEANDERDNQSISIGLSRSFNY